MTKSIALVAILSTTYAIAYFTMVNAWGLEVKNWSWLIGGYAASFVLYALASAVNREGK